MKDKLASVRKRHSGIGCPFSTIAVGSAMLFALTLFSPQLAGAQQFNVIHSFTGGADGAGPYAGLTIVGPGVFYGTTDYGGIYDNGVNGVVFALHSSASGWTLDPLYEFSGYPNDGSGPVAAVAIGPNRALYGTTQEGGAGGADGGTVFELQPPAHACQAALCYWRESIVHTFQGPPNDGHLPQLGTLVFDQAGNIYGTTELGGTSDRGVVFELKPSGSGWAVNVLHSFGSGSDGFQPEAGVIFDPAGNLYGTTFQGGTARDGTVFKLTPSLGGTWTESILHNFTGGSDGNWPYGTLVRDASGNLYGTASAGGSNGGGVVFELSYSSGGWVFSTLYSFSACDAYAGVTMDSAGNLYGVCSSGGAAGRGFAFELTNSSGSWTLTDLHDFTNGSDGAQPVGSVVVDSLGNLYGTAVYGGNDGDGTVWEITGLNRQR